MESSTKTLEQDVTPNNVYNEVNDMNEGNLYHINKVETSLLTITIVTYVDRDNNENKEEFKKLEQINNMSQQVTNALSCQYYEAWIGIKTKLNVKVITKESNNFT